MFPSGSANSREIKRKRFNGASLGSYDLLTSVWFNCSENRALGVESKVGFNDVLIGTREPLTSSAPTETFGSIPISAPWRVGELSKKKTSP
jgi:hypothetical protein